LFFRRPQSSLKNIRPSENQKYRHSRAGGNLVGIQAAVCVSKHDWIPTGIPACAGMTVFLVFRRPDVFQAALRPSEK
ncbi:hypothetical protein, partial [Neisseria bacilliformis]|uniref:hypothetical protein n=1 Tax=Neisseria bacilliformis TaxID=267212 RepID=UPI003C7479D8